MRGLIRMPVLAGCALGLVASGSGEAQGLNTMIGGYLNTATGTFSPGLLKVVPATAIKRAGTVKVVVKLTIESTIGTDQPITCGAEIYSYDASYDNSASSSVTAVRSGTSATATILIPYSWTMAASQMASVNVSCDTGDQYSGGVSRGLSFTAPGFTPSSVGATSAITLTGTM